MSKQELREEWRDIPETGGLYQVSSFGRVKSNVKPRILKYSSKTKYPSVSLIYGGKRHQMNIHRLVAEAFLPIEKGKSYVNHIDGDKHNNRLSNLEWVTNSENLMHGYRVLGRTPRDMSIGSHPQARPVLQLTLDGSLVKRWDSAARAHRDEGFLPTSISACAKGRIQHHKGFVWKYEDIPLSAVEQVRKKVNDE